MHKTRASHATAPARVRRRAGEAAETRSERTRAALSHAHAVARGATGPRPTHAWLLDLLFAIVLLAGLLGALAFPFPDGSDGTVDDATLVDEVSRTIAGDIGEEAAARIRVTSRGGVVALDGEASSASIRVRAAVDAGQVLGVRRVENRIRLQ